MENFQINDENKLYILPPQELNDSERLGLESMEFIKMTLAFEESTKLLTEKLQSLALSVETHKLKALGQKSKLENIEEQKKIKAQELLKAVNDRKIMLENLQNEFNSLSTIEKEQEVLIERLTNNNM